MQRRTGILLQDPGVPEGRARSVSYLGRWGQRVARERSVGLEGFKWNAEGVVERAEVARWR